MASLSSWPARLAGAALVLINASFACLGALSVLRGGRFLWEALPSPDRFWLAEFWLGAAFVAVGLFLFVEAFWPWLLRVPEETAWISECEEGPEGPHFWVAQWCRELDFPEPIAVETTWDVNAGLDLSAAMNGKIRLRVGLPLWLGLSSRQLRAVIFHELGHFTQRRRLAAVMRHQELGRRIKLGALWPGHATWKLFLKSWPMVQGLAQPWLRGLEAEADQFALRHGGEGAFASAMMQLKVLEQAAAQTMRTVQSSMASGIVPEDLCALFRHEASALLQPLGGSLERRTMESSASFTHPPMRERMAKLGSTSPQAQTGSPASMPAFAETPAWQPDETLSKTLTEAYYRHELGEDAALLLRVGAGDARCRLSRSQDAYSALEHYFFGLVRDAAPIRPLPQTLDANREWLGAMNAMARLPVMRKTLLLRREDWGRQRDRWEEAQQACRDVAAGNPMSGKIGLDSQSVLLDLLVKRETASGDLRNATEQLSERLTLGLLLLDHPDVAKAWPEARLWRKVATAWREELPLLSRLLGFMEEAAFDVARLHGLDGMAAGRRRVCESESRRQLWQALSRAASALERKTLSDTALQKAITDVYERMGSMDSSVVVERMENLYSRLSQAYLQALGDLAYAAGKAELAAGLKPWE